MPPPLNDSFFDQIQWVDHVVRRDGFLTCEPTPSMIEAAQELRRNRDLKYLDLYGRQTSDLNWVGELGEMSLYAFLKMTDLPTSWIHLRPNGAENLVCAHQRISVKTVKRKVPMRPGYGVQISAVHAEEQTAWFFFLSYQYLTNTMTFVGGITPTNFLQTATFQGAGTKVHGNYTIRSDHAIYNAEAQNLLPPMKWLLKVLKAGTRV